jgi:hypothetical protein
MLHLLPALKPLRLLPRPVRRHRPPAGLRQKLRRLRPPRLLRRRRRPMLRRQRQPLFLCLRRLLRRRPASIIISSVTFKFFFKQLGLVIVVVLIATAFDFAAHHTSPRFAVPPEYFRNKIIFATIWGMLALAVFRRIADPVSKAFIFSGAIAVVLQVKYFLQGYDAFFLALFLALHFLMFLAPAVIIFRKYPQYFWYKKTPQ